MRRYINQAVQGRHLTASEMAGAMECMLDDQARASQVAAFLTALRLKGETAEEIAAAAGAIRKHGPTIRAPEDVVVLDRDEINLDEETVSKTCSQAGGATNTFNISTATALTAAGGGVRVAKYGARADSTFCGSANVVGALGVNLNVTATEVERCIEEVGLGFLYAQLFHTPLALPTRVRGDIGIRTIFNLIGPLTNPARGRRQVLGVYLPERVGLMSDVLRRMDVREALVVHGRDTLDEISITGPTAMHHLRDGKVVESEFVPEDLGFKRAKPEDIRGGGAEDNARIIRGILDGGNGPRRDVVLLNAAAAFMVAGKANDLKTGVEMARESLASGRAKAKLDQLIDFTARCGVYQHKDVS